MWYSFLSIIMISDVSDGNFSHSLKFSIGPCLHLQSFSGDHMRTRFYRWHDVKTRPTLPPFTLDVISMPTINFLMYFLNLAEICCITMQYVKSSLIPLYTESLVIFSCETTLFTHGPNLVTHTLLLTSEVP